MTAMSPLAFIVAIAVLVAVHEWGHFSVARLCGVKVLRFSIGFGPRLWGWSSAKTGTEFMVSALPLGGYVMWLDERVGPLEPHERSMLFGLKSLPKKAAIVLAGPVANLVLAVALYSCVNWTGVEVAQPIVAKPPSESVLANAHFVGGERVQRMGFAGEDLQEVASFEDFRWWLTRGAIAHRNLRVEFTAARAKGVQTATLDLQKVDASKADAKLFEKIGASAPFMQARIGKVMPGEPAEQAHLQPGDVVLRVDNADIVDAEQLFQLIRASGSNGPPAAQTWQVVRGGAQLSLVVQPKLAQPEKAPESFLRRIKARIAGWFAAPKVSSAKAEPTFGRIGAEVWAPPAKAVVHYGALDGVSHAVTRTWETSTLSLRIMGQIVVGLASLDNLSGPISIAQYAGKSAALGPTQYLLFLALLSVSLGVLNLLPVPVLDGGHLMYYLWEALSGKPVSRSWMERLQKVGMVILLLMMSIAIFNDVMRQL